MKKKLDKKNGAHVNAIDGANINLVREIGFDSVFHGWSIFEGLVAEINVVLKGERELSSTKVVFIATRMFPIYYIFIIIIQVSVCV